MRFLVLLVISAGAAAQTVTPICSHALHWTPQGAVQSFRNGILQNDSDITLWQRTIGPNKWADQDVMTYVYIRKIDNPGQIPPSHYSAPIKETQICTGWNPPIFFSLDSTTANAGDVATLHLSFTNAIVLTAGLQFTLNYDAAKVFAIAVMPGPSTVNAGKSVSCSASAPASITCIIAGVPWTNMQDGVAAVLTVSTIGSAALPTTIGISQASGTLLGTNLPATIAIPGQVSPTSSGVINPTVSPAFLAPFPVPPYLQDTGPDTRMILQAVAACGSDAAGCAQGFQEVCSLRVIPSNCIVRCDSLGYVSCNCPLIQDARGIWFSRCS